MVPSDISPELVLVDPELAARERALLPDVPGVPLPPFESSVAVAPAVNRLPAQSRLSHRPGPSTFVLTVLAASLTLNGVLIWEAFQRVDTSAAESSRPAAASSARSSEGDPPVVATPRPPDRAGAAAREPTERPSLRWKAVPGASYYNVVLWRQGVRLLDLWPTRAFATIPREWTYRGVEHRLRPGTYLWFVFPGYGAKADRRYGEPVASGRLGISAS